jgi:hypothetical protein
MLHMLQTPQFLAEFLAGCYSISMHDSKRKGMIEFFFSDPLLLAIASSSSNGIAELSIRK